MADSQKRIGLIGLSAKGSWAAGSHLPYLQQTSLYKITALQNSSKSSAEAATKQYSLNDVATYDNPTAIAKDPNVDIVAVSVNVPQHYDLIRPALEAGKDVFCEWPLARNLAEAEELTKLAKDKGVRTMVGLQARQNPAILKVKDIVQSGKIGKVVGTTMFGHGFIFANGAVPSAHTYMLPIEAGANLVTIPMGHAVDALCYALGSELKDISASLANHYPEVDLLDENQKPVKKLAKSSHDFATISALTVKGGASVNVTYTFGTSRTGRDFVWEIIGTEGTLLLEAGTKGMGGHVQIYQPTLKIATGQGELQEVEVEKAANPSFNVGKAWSAWAGFGTDEGYSVTKWDDAVVRHKMIEAIYRSAEKGTRENYV